ncbi:MAG: methylenetetrahydrofolate reductase [Deltaproteobacteria bacterium]|nr:MAG: methylenetetrahydrofolate reductase [Deltaproteobacteria bacterium]
MRVIDLLKAKDRPLISLEFFPPRDEKAAQKFENVIDSLAGFKPDFVSVTFGAGGSTKEGSYQLVDKLKNEKGLPTVAYIAGYGLGPDDIVSVLDGYKNLGIETIFVIRGDKPHGDDTFTPHPRSMSHASDMISFIKERYDFCLGAAGYPEGHIEAESKEKDLEYLKLKVDNGAEYIVAQYAYIDSCFADFVSRARAIGIEVPILPGIMPIYTVKMTENLARICGTTITDEINQGLAALPPDDKDAILNFGIDLAVRQCRQLLKEGVAGLHFYTMNRAKMVVEVISRLKKEGSL